MRCVLQRVSQASCTVDDQVTGAIENGFVILVGFAPTDTPEIVERMVRKITMLRVFDDGKGAMNLNIQQTGGSILSISQFTLYAQCRKGNRPSFTEAARPETAIPLYEAFNQALAKEVPTATGIFGADMKIALINDGPVTIVLDSDTLFGPAC